ncbi:Nucleotidylyl transferase [Choiromyces venosus 120613-1]|uniref:Nicotinamide-nucleotide adenylyltransferase n=1 Tax=Choiromyces venosus 120613-1 TaxID=1336337 RepID=A0A3N4J6R2_9PEZI|nr:Nucleotidylyl transferase [Choiromyces venosus 120613-1]
MVSSSNVSTPSPSFSEYSFPSHRLRALEDGSKTPLVLVACGSFSPITHMHLRMFEMAVDHVKQGMSEFEVVGGYMSPVSDRYNKAGLASAAHRVRMCELACDETSDWLMVDPWEAIQPEYQPTAVVLDHIAHEINHNLGGIPYPPPPPPPANRLTVPPTATSTPRKPARVMLLGGSDLLQTMSQPGVWSQSDLNHILTTHGLFIIERSGSDISDALAPLKEWSDAMGKNWMENIHVVRQLIANDISSTRIRQFLRQGMSVQYLLPNVVIEYIRERGLYREVEGFRESRASSMPPLRREAVDRAVRERRVVVEVDGAEGNGDKDGEEETRGRKT